MLSGSIIWTEVSTVYTVLIVVVPQILEQNQ